MNFNLILLSFLLFAHEFQYRKLIVDKIIDLVESMQKLFSVNHHENMKFNILSGGKMNLTMPRDSPTIVVN